MSFLKQKTSRRVVQQFEALATIDQIVFEGIKNKFDTDSVNVTWTNTEQWYKIIKQKLIDENRRLKFPSIAISRPSQSINWQRPNLPDTGNKYVLQKKLIQTPQKRTNGSTYQPAVWQVTQCDPPIFLNVKYNLSLITNMQMDYNQLVQDVLSIFEGGRTYLLKQQNIEQRNRRLYNRYGVHIVITGQKSQILNNLEKGSRIFQKDFELSAQTYLYRNIQTYTTKTKNYISFSQTKIPKSIIRPLTPINISFSNISSSNIYVSWQAGSYNQSGFVLYRNSINQIPQQYTRVIDSKNYRYNDTNLSANTQYYYWIYSYNSSGFSNTPLSGSYYTGYISRWVGGDIQGINDWSISSNWDNGRGGLSRVPTYQDDVLFDNGSTGYNCILSSDVYCNSITQTTRWNKLLNLNNYSLSTNGDIKFQGVNSTLNLNGNITILNDGDFVISSSASSITASLCNLDIKGSGNTIINKSIYFNNITLRYLNKTQILYSIRSVANWGCNNILWFKGGNVTLSGTNYDLFITPSMQSNPLIVDIGTVISIPSHLAGMMIRPTNSSPLIVFVPQINISGSGQFTLQKTSTSTSDLTYNLNGNIIAPLFKVGNYNTTNTNLFNFNTNNHSLKISSGGFGDINLINTGTNTTMTTNFGSSLIQIQRFYVQGTKNVNINYDSSKWNCSGNWVFQTRTTVNWGTSDINIINTSTITSAGISFDKLTLNSPLKIISTSDGLTANRLLIQPQSTVRFKNDKVVKINNYVNGDWDGQSGKLVTLRSTSTTPWILNSSSGMNVSYVDVSYSNASGTTGGIIANNGTNIDSLNNINWIF